MGIISTSHSTLTPSAIANRRKKILRYEENLLDKADKIIGTFVELGVASSINSELKGMADSMRMFGDLEAASAGSHFGYDGENKHYTHSMTFLDDNAAIAASCIHDFALLIYKSMPVTAYINALGDDLDDISKVVDLCIGIYDFTCMTETSAYVFFGDQQKEAVRNRVEAVKVVYPAYLNLCNKLLDKKGMKDMYTKQAVNKMLHFLVQTPWLCNVGFLDHVPGYFDRRDPYMHIANSSPKRERFVRVMKQAAQYASIDLGQDNNPVTTAFQPLGFIGLQDDLNCFSNMWAPA